MASKGMRCPNDSVLQIHCLCLKPIVLRTASIPPLYLQCMGIMQYTTGCICYIFCILAPILIIVWGFRHTVPCKVTLLPAPFCITKPHVIYQVITFVWANLVLTPIYHTVSQDKTVKRSKNACLRVWASNVLIRLKLWQGSLLHVHWVRADADWSQLECYDAKVLIRF